MFVKGLIDQNIRFLVKTAYIDGTVGHVQSSNFDETRQHLGFNYFIV